MFRELQTLSDDYNEGHDPEIITEKLKQMLEELENGNGSTLEPPHQQSQYEDHNDALKPIIYEKLVKPIVVKPNTNNYGSNKNKGSFLR